MAKESNQINPLCQNAKKLKTYKIATKYKAYIIGGEF